MQRQSAPSLRRKKRRGASLTESGILIPVVAVAAVLLLAGIGFVYEFSSSSSVPRPVNSLRKTSADNAPAGGAGGASNGGFIGMKHLPILPIFTTIPDGEHLREEAFQGRPTVAGIMALLEKYIFELHMTNRRLADEKAAPTDIMNTMFDLAKEHLGRFDQVYRDKLIFPVREDGSIFLSLAAFREHLLADTLAYAFAHARNPEKLFIGAVVQNCFGRVSEDGKTIDASGMPCRTGAQVVGKNKQGRDQTKVSDAPPDKNGIEDFCNMPDFKKYCDSGQIRVLWVHETESLGPAMARYLASKLWGGETYFVQTDAHLMFAQDWDEKYRLEIQATRNYPKSVLSSYPPGFQATGEDKRVTESNGSKLCVCMTRLDDPNPIVRINTGSTYHGDAPRPTQIPFIAAGFFFTRAEFLVDVPFDPYMFWLFMGEEIALSMRAWTHGWDIYAPRKNLIAHQYRPGRMGLPKFWGSVNRLFRGSANNNVLQRPMIKRVKHMVGYPDASLDKIKEEGIEIVLTEIEHYGLGTERTWEAYMEHAHMTIDEETDAIQCSRNEWCNKGLKD